MAGRSRKFSVILGLCLLVLSGIYTCTKDGKINIFTLDQDKEFGQQLSATIAEDPAKYPLLERNARTEPIYQLLEGMRNDILASGKMNYPKEFAWELHVIHADVLNAFCSPGGYIYFYTGLLKYLDNEAQVAGVLGHEMAHADKRHSTTQLTKQYGIKTLIDMLTGGSDNQYLKIAAQLAGGAAELKFSRDDESEADACAVKFLAKTKYNALGVAGFFEKLRAEGKGSSIPAFLSTHPCDDDRIKAIHALYEELGSPAGEDFEAEYQQFKSKYLAGY